MESLNTLFAHFLQERRYIRNISPKTAIWYETAWKAFRAGDPADAPLTRLRLQTFVVRLRDRGVGPTSCNTYVKALNAFAKWLHEEGHSPERPHLGSLKTPRRIIKTLDTSALRAILGFKPRGIRQWRIFAVVATILDTGCRIDELLHAPVTAFDFDNLLITVRGKGDKERRVPFSFELRKVLVRYLRHRESAVPTSLLMFPSLSGAKWGQRNALRSYYLVQQRIGLQKSGFHRLRHSFATEYLRAGGDVVRLSRVLGHSEISTTMRYLHLLTEDLQKPHQSLSILNRLR